MRSVVAVWSRRPVVMTVRWLASTARRPHRHPAGAGLPSRHYGRPWLALEPPQDRHRRKGCRLRGAGPPRPALAIRPTGLGVMPSRPAALDGGRGWRAPVAVSTSTAPLPWGRLKPSAACRRPTGASRAIEHGGFGWFRGSFRGRVTSSLEEESIMKHLNYPLVTQRRRSIAAHRAPFLLDWVAVPRQACATSPCVGQAPRGEAERPLLGGAHPPLGSLERPRHRSIAPVEAVGSQATLLAGYMAGRGGSRCASRQPGRLI